MKASAIKTILSSYLINIYSINASITAGTSSEISQSARNRQIKAANTRIIIPPNRNNNYYLEIPFGKIKPKLFKPISILKDLNDKSFLSTIESIYDLIGKLKNDLALIKNVENLDSINQFMSVYNQLSSFTGIIQLFIYHKNKLVLIYSNSELDIEGFLKSVSDFNEPNRLLKLQTTFKSWIESLKKEINKFIEESKSNDEILKLEINAIINKNTPADVSNPEIPSSNFSNLLNLKGAKKYIFKLLFYFESIFHFSAIIIDEQQNFEEIRDTFGIPLYNQINPIYNYFITHSGNILGIKNYIDFDLKKFKENSDHFISEFSKFFESSIKCNSQHGDSEIEEKKNDSKK